MLYINVTVTKKCKDTTVTLKDESWKSRFVITAQGIAVPDPPAGVANSSASLDTQRARNFRNHCWSSRSSLQQHNGDQLPSAHIMPVGSDGSSYLES